MGNGFRQVPLSRVHLKHSRDLRRDQSEAEKKIWSRLRRNQVGGFSFRRQHPMGLYIVDFVCLERKLVIELDGGQHAENLAYDRKRDDFLISEGYKVLRFWDNDALGRTDDIMAQILDELQRNTAGSPPPLPSPLKGGGEAKAKGQD